MLEILRDPDFWTLVSQASFWILILASGLLVASLVKRRRTVAESELDPTPTAKTEPAKPRKGIRRIFPDMSPDTSASEPPKPESKIELPPETETEQPPKRPVQQFRIIGHSDGYLDKEKILGDKAIVQLALPFGQVCVKASTDFAREIVDKILARAERKE